MFAPRIASLVAVIVLTVPSTLFSQQEPLVAPGDRVRLTVPAVQSEPLVGTVVEIDQYVCFIAREGDTDPLGLPLTSIEKFEVSRGQKSYVEQGALLGLAIGVTVGVSVPVLLCGGWKECVDGIHTSDYAAISGPVFGVLGLLIGISGGASSSGEQWERVPLERLRVTIAPQPRGGLSVGMRIIL